MNQNQILDFIEQERLPFEYVHSTTKDEQKCRPGDRIKFTNKHLTDSQKQKLRDLMNEYHMVFSKKDEDLGRVDRKYGQHDIKLSNDTPIKQKPYKTPFTKETVIKDAITKMLITNAEHRIQAQ